MVSIAAFQAVDPGSIPGQRRNLFLFQITLRKSPFTPRSIIIRSNYRPHSILIRKLTTNDDDKEKR